jgi:hypothetical protein
MSRKVSLRFYFLLVSAVITIGLSAQTVPLGINYQAVARDNSGKELAGQIIQVKFSILSGSGVGEIAYEEVHENVRTTAFGVFNLIIGQGKRLAGTAEGLAGIPWEQANYFLKVEVDFGSGFINMGPMAFSAVPYALYAQRSLEPGPQGPIGPQGLKGDRGDPATDNQKLSFDGTNLSIAPNGNTVNLSTLSIPHSLSILGDTLSILGGNKVGLPNQIQDLTLDGSNILKITKNSSATSIDLSKYLDNKDQQTLGFNTVNNSLSITGGNSIDLTPMKQDLLLTGNNLTITNKLSPTVIDLSKYLQSLNFNSATNKLSISNVAGEVDLNKYLDDTDDQTIAYDSLNYKLSIANGNSVVIGRIIAFRSKKLLSVSASSLTDVTYIPSTVEYNDGNAFNATSGEFIAPVTGLYTFNVSYYADGSGGSRKLSIFYNSAIYEDLAVEIASGTQITTRSITMKLNSNDVVKLVINTGTSTQTGTGTFSGFRIY